MVVFKLKSIKIIYEEKDSGVRLSLLPTQSYFFNSRAYCFSFLKKPHEFQNTIFCKRYNLYIVPPSRKVIFTRKYLHSKQLHLSTLFVSSYNGRRAAENRKRRKEERNGGTESKRKKRREEEVKDDDDDGRGKEQINKNKKTYDNPVRARRIRIFPDKNQKKGINQFLGSDRFCYNRLVASQRNVGQGGVNLASFRKTIKDTEEEHHWLKEIPGEIKDVAVRDYDKARKAHFAKLNKKKDEDPNARHDAVFKFRSKKNLQQSFEVRGRDMTRHLGKFAFLNITKLHAAEKLPCEVDNAVRFVRDRLGKYYLVIPMEVKPASLRSEKQAPKTAESIVSLDPGIRTFQTTYDVNGVTSEWGKGNMKDIFIYCRLVDKCQKAWMTKTGSRKRATKKLWYRMIDKLKNKIKEIHRKMAVWLCENYKVILIPKLESSKMVKKGKRKINTMTARNMLTWSHYAFKQLLISKAELFPGVNISRVHGTIYFKDVWLLRSDSYKTWWCENIQVQFMWLCGRS